MTAARKLPHPTKPRHWHWRSMRRTSVTLFDNEPPRLATSAVNEKQRCAVVFLQGDVTLISKFQCSGHRPVCNRCTNRGLNCEYSVRELRTTIRPPPLRKNIREIPAPQPAKYSGICRSQNLRASVRAEGALRTPSLSYGTPPPPYTPRRGISTYDQVRWLPSQQSQALSAQNGGSRMATRDGLPAPIRVRRRSAGASVSNPSCRPTYLIPYQLLPHHPNPAHEEDLAYMRDGVASMPMPTPDSSHLPFDLEMPR